MGIENVFESADNRAAFSGSFGGHIPAVLRRFGLRARPSPTLCPSPNSYGLWLLLFYFLSRCLTLVLGVRFRLVQSGSVQRRNPTSPQGE